MISILPFISNNDINIYYEFNQGSPVIVFIHGYLGSHLTWKMIGYTRVLDKYGTIVFDRRGYGKSSKPTDPQRYSMREKCSDVVALLDELGIERAILWGFSGGGRIVFAMMKYHPDRVMASVIGGMSPYTLPPEYDMEERIRLLDEGMEAVVENFEKMYGKLPSALRNNLLQNEPQSIKADVKASLDFVGFAGDLPFFDPPVFLYVGTEDPFYEGCKRAVEVIPNCVLLELEGYGHYDTLVKVREIIPSVTQFLKEI